MPLCTALWPTAWYSSPVSCDQEEGEEGSQDKDIKVQCHAAAEHRHAAPAAYEVKAAAMDLDRVPFPLAAPPSMAITTVCFPPAVVVAPALAVREVFGR